jgi:hypothetical protein
VQKCVEKTSIPKEKPTPSHPVQNPLLRYASPQNLLNTLVVVRVLLGAGGARLARSGTSPVNTTALVVLLDGSASRGAAAASGSLGSGLGSNLGGRGGAGEGSRGGSGGGDFNGDGGQGSRGDSGRGRLDGDGSSRAGNGWLSGAGDLDLAIGGAGDLDGGSSGGGLGGGLGGGGGRRRRRRRRGGGGGRRGTVNEVLLENGQVGRVSRAVGRLQAVHVSAPPGTSRPPLGAHPDVAVVGHVREHAFDGRLANTVDTAGKLADEALLTVGLQPSGGGLEALLADCAADAGLGGTGAVGIKVLVHLVDDLVLRVGESLEVVVVVGPGPGSAPGVAFNEDVLGSGTGGTDTVDSGLVQVQDNGLVHVVVLVV